MIPKIIHQIWVGPSVPPEIAKLCNRTREINRDFWYRWHGDDIIEEYGDDPYVKCMQAQGESIAFIVDRMRVLLLRDQGGIYVDADCEAVRPFSSIPSLAMAHVDFLTGVRNPHRPNVRLMGGVALVDNTVMASAANGRMINRLCALYRPGAEKQSGHSFGIEVLRNLDESTVLLNYRAFYDSQVTPETIVLHDSQNAGSWKPNHKLAAAL